MGTQTLKATGEQEAMEMAATEVATVAMEASHTMEESNPMEDLEAITRMEVKAMATEEATIKGATTTGNNLATQTGATKNQFNQSLIGEVASLLSLRPHPLRSLHSK